MESCIVVPWRARGIQSPISSMPTISDFAGFNWFLSNIRRSRREDKRYGYNLRYFKLNVSYSPEDDQVGTAICKFLVALLRDPNYQNKPQHSPENGVVFALQNLLAFSPSAKQAAIQCR